MPIYETALDRDLEEEAFKRVAAWARCDYERTPTLEHVDGYLLRNGQRRAAVEFKARRQRVDEFPDVWLEVRKRDALLQAWFEQDLVAALYVVLFKASNQIGLLPVERTVGLPVVPRARVNRPGETPDDMVLCRLDWPEWRWLDFRVTTS